MGSFYYALYHGDTFIDLFENKGDIADRLGIKIASVEYYMSPAYSRRTKGRGYVVLKLEEENER